MKPAHAQGIEPWATSPISLKPQSKSDRHLAQPPSREVSHEAVPSYCTRVAGIRPGSLGRGVEGWAIQRQPITGTILNHGSGASRKRWDARSAAAVSCVRPPSSWASSGPVTEEPRTGFRYRQLAGVRR
jgi:hypothetical protein